MISRKSRSVWFALIIIAFAVAITIYIGQLTSKQAELAVAPANQEYELASLDNQNESEQPKGDITLQSAAAATSETSSEETTNTDAAANQTPSHDYSGKEATGPTGYKVKLPDSWFYSITQETYGSVFNFGTQEFGPDNPYNFSLTEDASGYIGSNKSIPSETVGALAEASEIKTDAGLTLNKKVYQADIPEFGSIKQVVYQFTLKDQPMAAVFWTLSKNSQQLELLDAMMKTLVP